MEILNGRMEKWNGRMEKLKGAHANRLHFRLRAYTHLLATLHLNVSSQL